MPSTDTSAPLALPVTTVAAKPPVATGTIVVKNLAGRKPFPTKKISSAEWEKFYQGGDGQFSLNCDVVQGINDLAILEHDDIIEIWTGPVLRYRGIVSKIVRSRENADSMVISGYSLWSKLSKIATDQVFVYPTSQDVSVAMRNVAAKYVTPIYPDLQFYADTLGLDANNVDARGKTVGDVFNELLALTGDRAGYGVDRNPATGAARLFLRKFDLTKADHRLSGSNKRLTAVSGEETSAEIVTRLRIQGGTPTFPNLVGNASFEALRLGSERDNLLDNGGLDEPNPLKGHWFPENGASFKTGSNTEGPTFAGDRMAELDGTSEYIHQTRDNLSGIVAGHTYVFTAHVKREDGSNNASLQVAIAWRDSSGNTIRTDVGGPSIFYADSVQWREASFSAVAPTGAKGFRIDIQCVNPSVLVDAVSLYDASLVLANGWRKEGTGNAEILDWAYPDAKHGGYCLHLKGTASDSDGPDISILSDRFAVQTRQSLRISVWVKSPPGVTSHPKLQLKIKIYDSNGTLSELVTQNINPLVVVNSGSGWTDWTKIEATFTLPQSVATTTSAPTTMEAQLSMRGNGSILVDAWSVRDAAADPSEPYVPDGPYSLTVGPRDVLDSTSPVYNAEDVWGQRWMTEQNDSITSWPLLKAAAARIFESYARLSRRPTLTLTGMRDKNFEPGETVALMGTIASLGDGNMPIYRVKETLNKDGLTTILELEREKPTLASIIASLRRKASVGASNGSVGGSGSSSGSVASNTTTVNGRAGAVTLASGDNITIAEAPDGTFTFSNTGVGTGTVTSVVLSAPTSVFSVAGSPVTTAGTLSLSLLSQSANLIFAGPTGGTSAPPTFRNLVVADLPASAVTPGSYTSANITIDAKGRVTAASSGSGGSGGVTAINNTTGGFLLGASNGVKMTTQGGSPTTQLTFSLGDMSIQTFTASTGVIDPGPVAP